MRRIFFGALLFIAVLGPHLQAHAETSIAVVDVQRLLTESKAAQSIYTQRQANREAFLNKISHQEQLLRDEEKELVAAQKKLSAEEFGKKRQSYEKNILEARRMAQTHKRKIEEASKKAMDTLREQLYLTVQSIADEKGYDLVISSRDVIAGAKSLDITEETLQRMNKNVSDIKLDIAPK